MEVEWKWIGGWVEVKEVSHRTQAEQAIKTRFLFLLCGRKPRSLDTVTMGGWMRAHSKLSRQY